MALFDAFVRRDPYIQQCEISHNQTRNIPLTDGVNCEVYFDILNRLGQTHESDRQTNGRTDVLIANAVFS